MSIIITGAGGLLGSHLMAGLADRDDIVGVDRHEWWGDQPMRFYVGDLAAPGFFTSIVDRESPDVVIHCAANVSVEACEADPGAAYAMNADLTRELARALPPHTLFVYVTTDGIFKGDAPFATENTLPCPRTVYARSKLHGEWEVALATPNHLIVRTNFFGWSSGRKQSSAEWLFASLRSRQPITLFQDFYFTPIYVVDLVEMLAELMRTDARGIFHLCGSDRISKYDFGRLLSQEAGLPFDSVKPGRLGESALRAPRPPDMSLRSERLYSVLGRHAPDCVSGVRRFVRDAGRPLSKRFRPVLVSG